MPGIDKSTDPFIQLNKLIKIQKTIHDALEKPVLLTSSRTKVVTDQLVDLRDLLLENNELCGIASSVFGPNSAFDTWVSAQAPEKQEKYRVTYDESLVRMQIGKRGVDVNLDQTSYRSETYANKSKSLWLKHQETHNQQQLLVANTIEQFILSERICLSNALASRVVLTEFLNNALVSPGDKNTINLFLTLVEKQRTAYNALNLHDLLNPADQSLETVISSLSEQYQSLAYTEYQHVLEALCVYGPQVEALNKKYPQLQHAKLDYTEPLLQRPMSYYKSLSTLNELMVGAGLNTSAVSHAMSTAKEREAVLNATLAVDALLSGQAPKSTQRQEAARRQIAASERSIDVSAYPKGPDQANQILNHRSTTLDILIIEGFPNLKPTEEKALMIRKALGGDLINPSLFDPNELNALYAQDNNPVWPLLKMIKPVDISFTLQNKIQAYLEVIKLTKENKLTFSDTPSLDQARLLAKDLLDLVEQRIASHPEEYNPKLIAKMLAINTSIESRTLTKVGKKIAQSFSSQDRSTMPDEEKTVQRQYREFLTGVVHAKQAASQDESTHEVDLEQISSRTSSIKSVSTMSDVDDAIQLDIEEPATTQRATPIVLVGEVITDEPTMPPPPVPAFQPDEEVIQTTLGDKPGMKNVLAAIKAQAPAGLRQNQTEEPTRQPDAQLDHKQVPKDLLAAIKAPAKLHQHQTEEPKTRPQAQLDDKQVPKNLLAAIIKTPALKHHESEKTITPKQPLIKVNEEVLEHAKRTQEFLEQKEKLRQEREGDGPDVDDWGDSNKP